MLEMWDPVEGPWLTEMGGLGRERMKGWGMRNPGSWVATWSLMVGKVAVPLVTKSHQRNLELDRTPGAWLTGYLRKCKPIIKKLSI